MSLFAMTSASHPLSATHERRENLVVVLAAAQIARDAVRELLAGGVRIRHEIAGRGHHESGHAEGALKSLLVDDALLHRTQFSRSRVGQPLDGEDLLAARAPRE